MMEAGADVRHLLLAQKHLTKAIKLGEPESPRGQTNAHHKV
jgi:hypothetical protein